MRSNSISSIDSSSSRTSQPLEAEEPTIQIFVKTVSGETIPLTLPTSTTLSTLRTLLSLRTHIPTSSLRLTHASKHLTSLNTTLSANNITENTTLTLALPLRGGAKQRCEAKSCTALAQKIVGTCGFCEKHFCRQHRMLESHNCEKLEDCKAQEREKNREKLESERTVVVRGI